MQSRSKRLKLNRRFSMDDRERGSYARDMYSIQDTSRMGTAKVKQEEETHKKIIII